MVPGSVTSDIYFCGLSILNRQTFWSEGSAYTETFSKAKRQLFKVEDCSNPKVDDEGNKDQQWHHSLL